MTRPDLNPVVSLLVDAVRPGPARPDGRLSAEVAGLPVDTVLEIADNHRLGPALARYLAGWDEPPTELGEAAAPLRTAQLVRHLSILAELGPVASALDGAGIRWAVVKGPVAASVLWPSPDLRDYRDLDLLVEPARFAEVLDLLHDVGGEQVDLAWGLARRQLRSELTFILPRGTVLDLHWHVVNEAPLRGHLRWTTGELLDRRRTVTVGSVQMPTLDDVDTFLHMAYHATHSGAYRLLWLKDVELARAALTDPEEAVERAERARLDLMARLVLERVDRVLGPTPALPWRSSRGALWRATVEQVDRRSAVPPAGRTGTHRTLFTSARTTTAQTVGALALEAVGHVLERRGARADAEPENPLLVPDGDRDARGSYLAHVGVQR